MTSLGDALGKTLVWAYDALGNRIRQENRSDAPMTASITWTYDGAGRALTRTADGVTTTTTYDANGNRLTVGDGTYLINAAYDRLNRPLTVDDEDAGTTADTTYTYSLTAPAWTDVTGTYGVTLDTFDRALQVNDPVNASNFITTYRADGQRATFAQPNGNTTDYTYDTAGHLTGSDDDTAGGTDRAVYAWTYNRAGQVLTEASTISGDASNGLVTYAYDPLGRLTGSTLAGTTTAYGWDATTNRTSVQIGAGTPATTAYNGANRPISGANPTESFSSDDDGRLLTRPDQQLVWDRLGRLTQVKNGGGTVVATYTYDPLDRLRTVDTAGVGRIRFRYVGLSTSAAQWLDDVAGTVTRSIGTGWSGERLLDWTGSGSNIRIYGENAHHDVTWLASSTGTVSQALRYDPWGTPRATVPSGYSPFRFQGSWFDDVTSLSWVITRWYAPSLGRFVSEDTLLGDPIDPPSRQLYAYGQGEPVGRWDPDGRHWYKVKEGDTRGRLALRFYGNWARRAWIEAGNPGAGVTPITLGASKLRTKVGQCLWIPFTQEKHQCGDKKDSTAAGTVLWGRFDRTVRHVGRALRERARDGADGLGIMLGFWLIGDTNILIRWAQLVREGGLWDIKHDLARDIGRKQGVPYYTAVRDDPAPESFRSDLWGLIHYGYLGRAHSIPPTLLRAGNRAAGGVQGADDDWAMELGMDMFRTFGANITDDEIRYSVLDQMAAFRTFGSPEVEGNAIWHRLQP